MKEFDVQKFVLTPFLSVAGVIIIIAGMMQAKTILIPILLSIFLSIISVQPIFWLNKKKVPYALAVIIVLLVFLILFILLGGLIGNSLANFTTNVPVYSANLKKMMAGLADKLNTLGISIGRDQILELINPGNLLRYIAQGLGEIGAIVSNLFLILIISVFILMEVRGFILKANVIELVQNRSFRYLDDIGNSIRHYLSIKTLISLITGILVTIWLIILGVDYPVLWGVVAFLLNYIPSIGSIIAAIPAALLALIQLGVSGLIWTAVGYLVINLVMGNILEPKIMGKGLGLSTLVVFLSLIVWGYIFGSIGMFLSVPLTMSIKIMLEQSEKTKWLAMLLGTSRDVKKMEEEYHTPRI
jgi:predicted PurR-regulated permease PerM